MIKNKIALLFKSNSWEQLVSSYSPHEVAKSLSFMDGLRTAYRLLYNDNWDEDLQEYAIKLFNEIRHIYQVEWNQSWEYDALLGLACEIRYKHEERYEAYKRAFERAENPPPRLLIEMAGCCICPGPRPISYDRAIELVMQALKNELYVDGVGLLHLIYSFKDDKEQKSYWFKILENSNEKFTSPSIEPKFLVDEYLAEIARKKRQKSED